MHGAENEPDLMLGGGRPPVGLKARQMNTLNAHRRLSQLLDKARQAAVKKCDKDIIEIKEKLRAFATEKKLYRRRSLYLLEHDTQGFLAFHDTLRRLQLAADAKHTFRRQSLHGEDRETQEEPQRSQAQLDMSSKVGPGQSAAANDKREEVAVARRKLSLHRRRSSPAVLHLNGQKLAMRPDSMLWKLLEGDEDAKVPQNRKKSAATLLPPIGSRRGSKAAASTSRAVRPSYIVKELDDDAASELIQVKPGSPEQTRALITPPPTGTPGMRPISAPTEKRDQPQPLTKRFLVRERTSYLSPTLTAELKRNDAVPVRRRLSLDPATLNDDLSSFERLQLARRRRSKVIELPITQEQQQDDGDEELETLAAVAEVVEVAEGAVVAEK